MGKGTDVRIEGGDAQVALFDAPVAAFELPGEIQRTGVQQGTGEKMQVLLVLFEGNEVVASVFNDQASPVITALRRTPALSARSF